MLLNVDYVPKTRIATSLLNMGVYAFGPLQPLAAKIMFALKLL